MYFFFQAQLKMCIFLCEQNLNIFKSLKKKKQNKTKRLNKQNKINRQKQGRQISPVFSYIQLWNDRTQVEKIFNSRCFLSSYVTIEVWIAETFHRRTIDVKCR